MDHGIVDGVKQDVWWDSETVQSVTKKIKADTLSLTLCENYKDAGGIGFKCGMQNKVDGDLQIKIDGKSIGGYTEFERIIREF